MYRFAGAHIVVQPAGAVIALVKARRMVIPAQGMAQQNAVTAFVVELTIGFVD